LEVSGKERIGMKERRAIEIMSIMVLISLFALGGFGCEKQKGEVGRVQTIADKPLQEGAFKAKISIESPPTSVKANSFSKIKLRVRNLGNSAWPSKGQPGGRFAIYLSYHWLDQNGNLKVLDGYRNSLPMDLNPNQDVEVEATVIAPDEEGEYILEFDMLQELVAWFKDKGSETARAVLRIE
jgi:hypothetical protein